MDIEDKLFLLVLVGLGLCILILFYGLLPTKVVVVLAVVLVFGQMLTQMSINAYDMLDEDEPYRWLQAVTISAVSMVIFFVIGGSVFVASLMIEGVIGGGFITAITLIVSLSIICTVGIGRLAERLG